jgi:hypothetical protein
MYASRRRAGRTARGKLLECLSSHSAKRVRHWVHAGLGDFNFEVCGRWDDDGGNPCTVLMR